MRYIQNEVYTYQDTVDSPLYLEIFSLCCCCTVSAMEAGLFNVSG